MKYQERKKWKKTLMSVLAILLAITLVISMVAPFVAHGAVAHTTVSAIPVDANTVSEISSSPIAARVGQDKFQIEWDAGFDDGSSRGAYITQEYMPLHGIITNLGESFRGELQVISYQTSYYDYSPNGYRDRYAMYYQEIELGQGASKTIDMEIGMNSVYKYIEICLVDESGDVLYRDFEYLSAKSPETRVMAVLSGQPSALKYLSDMNLPNAGHGKVSYTEGSNFADYNFTVYLDENTFPKSASVMRNFDVLIVDDFDMNGLSQTQKDALHQWLKDGGVLILGTGVHGMKVLPSVDFLFGSEVSGVTQLDGLENVWGQKITISEEVMVSNIISEELETLWEQDGQAIISKMPEGKGVVYVMHMALSLAPMMNMKESREIIGLLALDYLDFTNDGNTYYYDYKRYIAERFPAIESHTMILVIGIISLYVFLVGPVLYFILKRKDKRERGWVIIPAMAFIFMSIVFFATRGSGYSVGMIRTVGLVELDDSSTIGAAELGIAVKGAEQGDVVLSAPTKLPINIASDDYYYYGYDSVPACIYKVLSGGEETSITFVDNSSWATNYFTTETVVDMGGNLTSTIIPDSAGFSGRLTNGTQKDFSDVFVYANGYIISLGEMKSGSSVDVTFEDAYQYHELYRLQDQIRNDVRNGIYSRREGFEKHYNYSLLQSRVDNSWRNISFADENAVWIYALSNDTVVDSGLYLNGQRVASSDTIMYCQKFDFDLSIIESFRMSFNGQFSGEGGVDYYRDYQGTYVLMAYQSTVAHGVYQLPEDIRIREIEMKVDTPYSYMEAPEEIEILNMATDSWEKIENGDILSANGAKRVSDYISVKNEIMIRFDAQEYREMSVPQLIVEGGGIYAGD